MLSSPKEPPPLFSFWSRGGRRKKGTRKKNERKKEKKRKSLRCDAPGWLRRSTRFHGIKDSALNPRDCREARGCIEAEEGEGKKDKERDRERDRASARSERGQWSRRGLAKGVGRQRSGFLGSLRYEVRRKAALCDECGTVGQRTPWPPPRPTPLRCIHPDAIRTTLRFSLPSTLLSLSLSPSLPFSLPSFASSFSLSFTLSALPVIRFLLTDRITLRYYCTTTTTVPIAWNVVRSFSRFLGGLEYKRREGFTPVIKWRRRRRRLAVSSFLSFECRWSSRLLTSNASNSRCFWLLRIVHPPFNAWHWSFLSVILNKNIANPHNVTGSQTGMDCPKTGRKRFGKIRGRSSRVDSIDLFFCFYDLPAPRKSNLIRECFDPPSNFWMVFFSFVNGIFLIVFFELNLLVREL